MIPSSTTKPSRLRYAAHWTAGVAGGLGWTTILILPARPGVPLIWFLATSFWPFGSICEVAIFVVLPILFSKALARSSSGAAAGLQAEVFLPICLVLVFNMIPVIFSHGI